MLLFCLLCTTELGAATLFGPGSGLPNLSVRAFALDPDGYVWMGTEDGVYRFDGHRFEALDLSAPGAPLDAYVEDMLATPTALYVATRTGLHRYDWGRRRLELLRTADGAGIGGVLSLTQVPALDGGPQLLAGTNDGRLLQLVDASAAQPGALDLGAASDLGWILDLDAHADHVWLATTKGAFKLDRRSGLLQPVRFAMPEIDDGARYVRALFEHPRGSLWIGFWNDGLVRLDLATGKRRWFHPAHPGAGALRATSIYGFDVHGERTYIATNRGLVYHEPVCECLRGLNHPDWDRLDGIGVIVDAIMPQGDAIWAAQVGNGATRFAAEDLVFEHQVKTDGHSDRLAAPGVRALHAGSGGRLWLGSFAGVQWVDAKERVRGQPWRLESLPWSLPRSESRFVWSIREDADQSLLVGTGTGLYRSSNGALEAFEPPIESARCTLTTAEGRRYLGSVFGLFRVDGKRLLRVPMVDGGAAQPPVWSLAELDDELWAGTANGLYRFDSDDKLIAHHGIGLEGDQLPGSLVLQQRATADGRVFMVTSGGLVEVRGNAKARIFAVQPALLAAQVRSPLSIEIDGQQKLWLGTPRGLVRYDPVSAKVDVYDRSDGLVSDQLLVNASANDGERLYFGSVAGLISFDPTQLPARQAELSPRVTRRRIGQGPWQPNSGDLALATDHAPLQLELSALHYRWPERVRYAYRWTDSESAFTELGDARTALFSNLPSGRHVLELRAVLDNPFKAQATRAVLTIDVATAWHQTWWGRVAVALGLMLSVYLWMSWRNRTVREQRRLLEREVLQRTQELRAASVAMEAANARLQELASNDPLTGLANRRHLFERARQLQAIGEPLAVIMLDIDHFKQINDRHGHDAGDAVLTQLAALLREFAIARTSSSAGNILCARYGGEEFACLLAGEQALGDAVEKSAVDLLTRITAHPFPINPSTSLRVTASIGCAAGSAREDLEALIRRADAALYRVKSTGRANWQAG